MELAVVKADADKIIFRKKVNIQLLSLEFGLERSLSGRENTIFNSMLLDKSRKHILCWTESISGMITRLGFSIAMDGIRMYFFWMNF